MPLFNPSTREKRCCLCGDLKPLEAFYRHRSRKDGRANACSVCSTALVYQWRARNRALVYLQRQRYRRNSPKYRSQNIAQNFSERARAAGAVSEVRPKDIRLLIESAKGTCFYCGAVGELEIDHMVPTIRGGDNVVSNLCACCVKCNRSKGCLTAAEFVNGGVRRYRALVYGQHASVG